MKKHLALIMILIIAVSFCACNSNNAPADNKLSEVSGVTEGETNNGPTLSRDIPQNFLAYDENNWRSVYVVGSEEIGRDKIKSITFLDTLKDMPADAWDASRDQNGSVMAWVDGGFNLFIAGEGGVSATYCKGLFKDYYNAEYINFNNCFYTDLVEDMSKMFASSDGFKELDLSFFNTSNVKYMNEMFSYCTHLESVNLSSFDTSRVLDMNSMFQLTSLKSLDVSGFDTSRVNDMHNMFDYCDEIKSLDLSSFDTSKVTNMKRMFNYCESLEELDISSFNTASVTDMNTMFSSCKKLNKLDLSKFDFSSVQNANEMFAYSGELTDIGCTIELPDGCTSENMYLHSGLE